MKELFKSKAMMGFMVLIVSLTIFTAKPDKTINMDKSTNEEVSINI